MIKRKAGVNVKFSDVFKKRALLGAAIFCITAIATVGALSIGGNEEDNTPDSLADLNETEQSEKNLQMADETGGDTQPENPDQTTQVADNTKPENPDGTAQVADNMQPENPDETAQVADNTQPENPDGITQVADNTQPENPDGTAQVADNTQAEVPDQTAVLSPQLIAEQLSFDKTAGLLWPISGEVLIPYSPEHGVFHQTLDQFSTSDAIVLSSTVGTEVKAAAKGVVTSIEEHYRTGTTVTLALGNDTTLVYGQLEVADLETGDVVEAGECIGTVAEPTKYYVVEGPNLYFQVVEGETSIDPTTLLQEERK